MTRRSIGREFLAKTVKTTRISGAAHTVVPCLRNLAYLRDRSAAYDRVPFISLVPRL